MGIPRTQVKAGLADALFTQAQQRVLGLLFGQPERRFQGAELIRLARSGTGGTHRQLTRLTGAGLVTVTNVGNQRFYQANPRSPVYPELHGLVVKTVGIVGPLEEALQPLASRIDAAFVYGSVAKGKDRASSDIDLMVIGSRLDYAAMYVALRKAEEALARQVNPTVMTAEDWRKKKRTTDSFAARVAAGEKLFIVGNSDVID